MVFTVIDWSATLKTSTYLKKMSTLFLVAWLLLLPNAHQVKLEIIIIAQISLIHCAPVAWISKISCPFNASKRLDWQAKHHFSILRVKIKFRVRHSSKTGSQKWAAKCSKFTRMEQSQSCALELKIRVDKILKFMYMSENVSSEYKRLKYIIEPSSRHKSSSGRRLSRN